MGAVGKWFGFGKNEHYDEGLRLYQAGAYMKAIESFKVCLSSDPDGSTRERARNYMAGALGKLAREAVEEERWENALAFLDEAITLRPTYADLRILRAQVFHALGREEDRMFEINFALDKNPRYGFAILQHGLYLMDQGDAESGAARVREAVANDPRLDTEQFRQGLSAAESGAIESARRLWGQVTPKFRPDPDGLVRSADEFAHQGRWQDAAESYRRALEIAPKFADVRCKYGQVLLQLDEVEQAIAEFREALTINPKYGDAYALLGVALRRSGRDEEALAAFRATLDIDPGHLVAAMEIERRV